jgi:hypothetical protein
VGELARPLWQVLDGREVVEDLVLRRVEDGGDGACDHGASFVVKEGTISD